jgi:hypothetical protein
VFGKLNGMMKLSEASVIVKQAFRSLPLPMLPFDPEVLARRLVAISHNTKPDLFNGKQGKPPHPLTTAAVSLAGGLTSDDYEFVHTTQKCIFYALGNILIDASSNAQRYGMNAVDLHLLQLCEAAYFQNRAKFEAEAEAVLGSVQSAG